MRLTSDTIRILLLFLFVCLLPKPRVLADDQSPLSKEQIKQFLLTAKVIKSKSSKKGVTNPSHLTLTDGTITHDASFQPIDVHKTDMKLESGAEELNFVDSYKYNIAGYAVAELLGIDDMVPVYVERMWEGQKGSFSWWLPVMMDEGERLKRKLEPPDQEAWNRQMYKIRVFDQLLDDSDVNLTNVLISPDWKIWRIDFTRAFRRDKNLRKPDELVRCDRQLLEKLKTLDENVLREKTRGYLDDGEVKALMARRDKIVAHFAALIQEKGESEVLY